MGTRIANACYNAKFNGMKKSPNPRSIKILPGYGTNLMGDGTSFPCFDVETLLLQGLRKRFT